MNTSGIYGHLPGILRTLVFIAFLVGTHEVNGQFLGKKKQKKTDQTVDSVSVDGEFDIYNFKNINRIPSYFHKGKMEQILKLERSRNWVELFPKLRSYVKNFGIRNFYRDTYWIWRLAKLTELYGSEEDATALYKLVLRHHHEHIDIREIELYYDSLNQQEVDLYVPLDYYYKLVEHRKAIDTLRPPRGVLLNMGRRINSRDADYGPTLSYHDDVLIFTSKRNELRKGLDYVQNEDLFFSRKSQGYWDLSHEMKAINSIYNEGSACLSRDGKTLYFSRCQSPLSMGSCDIFVAYMQEDSVWGGVQNLGVNVNSLSWDSHPSLSHTEDTLYFASDRIGGFGLSDIYFTFKTKNGDWADAQNLGPVVNTRQNDVNPFYHPKHHILYFSSNGLTREEAYGIFPMNRSPWISLKI